MKQPKIELKNVKTFRGTDFQGLNATVYVDGKRCCEVLDEGNGGGIQFQNEDKKLYATLEAYAKSQPKRPFTMGGKKHMIPVTVETLIEDALEKMHDEKELKKLSKKFANHIIWGVPGSDEYVQIKCPRNLSEYPTDLLQNKLNEIKRKFKKGEEFLNTNFTELKLKA